jgi:signal transduction histidine kinase
VNPGTPPPVLPPPPGVEITSIPELDRGETALVEAHSLVNMLNVLSCELALIGKRVAGDFNRLRDSQAVLKDLVVQLRDPAQALAFARSVGEHERRIAEEIEAVRLRHGLAADAEVLRPSLENIRSVFRILELRAQEWIQRAADPDRWVEFHVDALRHDFNEVFAAFERNSHGRYHIIYNLAQQSPIDYFVTYDVGSVDGRTIALPLLLKDVMRDLVANARKYTAPGGTLAIGLYETAGELRFVVDDTGRGIPPDEVTLVAQYGRRASNVADVRTMGGGFGLTKAFLVTKRFGGRMWIHSRLGVGTRVTLVLPRPATAEPRPAAAIH